jgi:hypothetical protein
MDAAHRWRGIGFTLAAGLALFASGPAPAQVPQGRCAKDALEKWYCAADAKGVAVVDNLGAVVCSPGRCVEVEDEWECSAVSGGGAELTPDGPVCEGGCRSPRAVDCNLGMGPA